MSLFQLHTAKSGCLNYLSLRCGKQHYISDTRLPWIKLIKKSQFFRIAFRTKWWCDINLIWPLSNNLLITLMLHGLWVMQCLQNVRAGHMISIFSYISVPLHTYAWTKPELQNWKLHVEILGSYLVFFFIWISYWHHLPWSAVAGDSPGQRMGISLKDYKS